MTFTFGRIVAFAVLISGIALGSFVSGFFFPSTIEILIFGVVIGEGLIVLGLICRTWREATHKLRSASAKESAADEADIGSLISVNEISPGLSLDPMTLS